MATKLDSLMDYVVEHERGGGGWVIVQILPRDDCRIAPLPARIEERDRRVRIKPPDRAFLAWNKLLKRARTWVNPKDPESEMIDHKIPDDLRSCVEQIRADLKSGAKTVVSSHIQ